MKKVLPWVVIAVLLGLLAAQFIIRPSQDSAIPQQVDQGEPERTATPRPAATQPELTETSRDSVAPTFETSNDFSLLLAQSLPAAEAGDAEAANLVAKIFDHCIQFSIAGPKFNEGVRYIAERNPEAAPALLSAASRIERRCQKVAGGDPISPETVEDWTQRAAGLGSIESRARHAVRHPDQATSGVKGVVLADALSSGDPNAIFEAADLVSSLSQSDVPAELERFVGSDIDLYAWKVAACRIGAACQPGTPAMDAFCVSGGACGQGTLEQSIRSSAVPSESWPAVEERVSKIVKLAKK